MTGNHNVNLGKSTRFLWNSERKDNLKSKLRSRSTGSVYNGRMTTRHKFFETIIAQIELIIF
jgi:hypothetical protein